MASHFAIAFEAAPDAMCIVDGRGRCIEANRAARLLFGAGPEHLIGAPLAEVVTQLPRIGKRAGGIVEGVVEDGSTFAVEVVGGHVAHSDGFALVVFREAAEQQAKDLLLERQHRQLIKAQAIAHFGSWQRDLVTGEVEWSDEMCQIFGVAPGSISRIGQLVALIHPDDRGRVVAAIDAAIVVGGPLECGYRVVRPDGVLRFVESRAEVVVDERGVPQRIDGTVHDVTARVRSNAERASLSMVLDVSQDAITACDTDGNFTVWNRGAEALYGYTAAEALGQPLSLIVPPTAHTLAWANFQWILRGKPVERQESTRVTKDGRTVVVAVTLSPMVGPEGDISGVAAIGRDITEYKRTLAELADAHKAAVEASRLKSEFMANMNHELRTPLNGVIGVRSLLERTALSEEQREYVEALRVSGAALMAVIEDILDFSKIEAGRLDLEEHPFELRELVEDVCSVVAVGQAHRAVEVIPAVDLQVPARVRGDAKRVRQVLTNLINNAVKFTEVGQVTVRVTAKEPETGPTRFMRFEVIDTGIGIEPEAQQLIFESFAQADGSTTRRYGGTGLGLTIARQLVTLMGGDIGVRSAPGEGSTFWFTLPLRPADGGQLAEPAPALVGARVLIVDDKATNRELLERRLRAWGTIVASAADGPTALAALRAAVRAKESFDLVLLDYNVPGVTGAELPRAIRADPMLRNIRLVMMVAARDTTVAAALTVLDGTLTKPLHEARLHAELVRVLDGSPPEPRVRGGDTEVGSRPCGRGRVLVAEDNLVNQLIAVRMLEQRGFDVDVARDGRETLALHAKCAYGAIFMDCQMPELDGYEATRQIRIREGTARHTPVIAFTASTLQGDIDRCLQAGMDHYCGKPIEAGALDDVLDRVFSSSPVHIAVATS